jgi:proliferating cell nuclear antigen PCNA
MEIVIRDSSKSDAFATIFQHIKLFTDHVSLLCGEEGVKMQCMDNAHVAIVELALPKEWFDTYKIVPGQTSRVGFNATFLHRILSSREKDQQTHLVYSLDDTDRLIINLTSPDLSEEKKPQVKPSFDKHFELPLMDIEEEGMCIPEIEYTAELSMLSSQFSAIITQLKMFGDSMEVQCSEERIALASTSTEQGKMFVEIGISDLSEFSIDEGADLTLLFSLTYLKNICAYNKISENVRIQFSDSYPMRVEYNLGNNGSLVFHLAPKIDD